MNLLASFAFTILFFEFFLEFTNEMRIIKLILISLGALLTLPSFCYSIGDFFLSGFSKRLRIKLFINELFYGSEFENIEMKNKFLKGKGLYCNPFSYKTSICTHEQCLTWEDSNHHWGSSENQIGHFPSCEIEIKVVVNKNPHSSEWNAKLDGLEESWQLKTVVTNKYELRELMEKSDLIDEGYVMTAIFKLKNINVELEFYKSLIKADYMTDTGLNRSSPCWLNLNEGRIDLDVSSNLYNIFCIYSLISRRGLTCCFILENRNHCLTLDEAFVKICLNNDKIRWRKFHTNELKFVEGERLEIVDKYWTDIYNTKFGEKFTELLFKYVKNNFESKLIYKILPNLFLEKANSNLSKYIGNWQCKRLLVDLSYIRELFGLPRLYNISRISPTVRVQKFMKLNHNGEKCEKKIYHYATTTSIDKTSINEVKRDLNKHGDPEISRTFNGYVTCSNLWEKYEENLSKFVKNKKDFPFELIEKNFVIMNKIRKTKIVNVVNETSDLTEKINKNDRKKKANKRRFIGKELLEKIMIDRDIAKLQRECTVKKENNEDILLESKQKTINDLKETMGKWIMVVKKVKNKEIKRMSKDECKEMLKKNVKNSIEDSDGGIKIIYHNYKYLEEIESNGEICKIIKNAGKSNKIKKYIYAEKNCVVDKKKKMKKKVEVDTRKYNLIMPKKIDDFRRKPIEEVPKVIEKPIPKFVAPIKVKDVLPIRTEYANVGATTSTKVTPASAEVDEKIGSEIEVSNSKHIGIKERIRSAIAHLDKRSEIFKTQLMVVTKKAKAIQAVIDEEQRKLDKMYWESIDPAIREYM